MFWRYSSQTFDDFFEAILRPFRKQTDAIAGPRASSAAANLHDRCPATPCGSVS